MSQGLTINISYDSSVSQAPAGFTAAIAAVVQFYESEFTNPITLNIDVGYGEIDGQPLSSGALGESDGIQQSFTYSQVRNALLANAISNVQQQAFSTLPATSPISGNISIPIAEATALGLTSSNTTFAGYVGFSSTAAFTYNNSNGVPSGDYDFYGVVAHEISEVMGRVSNIGTGSYSVLDLFRYAASGVRALSNRQTTAYFSIDGGTTDLGNFNTNPRDDYGDWAASVGNDAYDAVASPGVVEPVSQTDLTVLNVLGYDLGSSSTSVTSATITAVSEQPSTGVVGAGTLLTITLSFNESVIVTGTPTLALNDGATATYTGGSGTGALIFSDTVAARDTDVASLAVNSVNVSGSTIGDGAGNSANLSLSGLTQSGPQINTDANFVQQLYEMVLLRQPNTSEVTSWVSQLTSSLTRTQVDTDFVTSAETQNFVLPIVRLYQTFLDRAPDPGGLNGWVNFLRTGTAITVIASDFINSTEFQNIYGNTTPTGFITDLYQNVLNRAPDAVGLQNWLSVLTQNNDSVAAQVTVALGFANSQEFINDSTAPIDAWLAAAGESGSYASSIAYFSSIASNNQILTAGTESEGSNAGAATIVPRNEGLTSAGSAHWPNANFSLDTGSAITLTAGGSGQFVVAIPTTGAQSFDFVLQVNASAGAAIFIGGESGQVLALDQNAVPSSVGTILASDLASDLIFAHDARVSSGDGSPPALTVIGGAGWNTVELANAGDFLDGGLSGHNTLVVNAQSNSAGFAINLAAVSGVNEVTGFAGSSSLPTVTNFQDVDLSYITGGPAGGTVIAAPGGSTIIDSHFSDSITLASSGAGSDLIGLSGNVFSSINLMSAHNGPNAFSGFTTVANFDAAGVDHVALTTAYAESLTNGIAGAASIIQVDTGGIDTTASAGSHGVFFVNPITAVTLTNVLSVEAAIGSVKTAATDTFIVFLDNGSSAASSTQFGVYEVSANETAGATPGTNSTDSIKLVGLFSAVGGFAEHNYTVPIAS